MWNAEGGKRWLVGRMWLGEMMKLVAIRALMVWLLFANADTLIAIPLSRNCE